MNDLLNLNYFEHADPNYDPTKPTASQAGNKVASIAVRRTKELQTRVKVLNALLARLNKEAKARSRLTEKATPAKKRDKESNDEQALQNKIEELQKKIAEVRAKLRDSSGKANSKKPKGGALNSAKIKTVKGNQNGSRSQQS